ncbi:MAG: hypothetical protein JWR10_4509 [Rubritepida sp.]|nr:hypothetical protein [Rubritepida sp.]
MDHRGCDYTVGPLKGRNNWRWTVYNGTGPTAKPILTGDVTGQHERVAKQEAMAAIDEWRKKNRE